MTPFQRALHDQIRLSGPLTVEAYMAACNDHYYASRDPLGSGGDFTTAPEISQMFGEIVGAVLADTWTRAGSPEGAAYVELGPGRGTLAADALRLCRTAGFTPAVHLVETSPSLRQIQAQSLPGARWHNSLDTLPTDVPLLVVANEFFDALPIRQHDGELERHVILAGDTLAFDHAGEIVESSPVRDSAVDALARRLAAQGGVALIIDYGHSRSGPGDTLQAVKAHRFAAVLDQPGEQDLTSHVDFQRVMEVALAAGCAVSGPAEQGAWLEELGITVRAAALAGRTPQRMAEIEGARARLCRPDQMGALFKVLALHAPAWPSPAGLQRAG